MVGSVMPLSDGVRCLDTAIEAIREMGQELADRLRSLWCAIRGKLRAFFGKSPHELFFPDTLTGEMLVVREQHRRQSATAAANRTLGNDPIGKIRRSSPAQRADLLKGLNRETSRALSIPMPELTFENFGICQEGAYDSQANRISLNAFSLSQIPMSDEDAMELLYAYFHEVYHAFQHQAIVDPLRHGVSAAEAAEWKKNFKHYIPPELNRRRYRDQAVEVSARAFGQSVVQTFS